MYLFTPLNTGIYPIDRHKVLVKNESDMISHFCLVTFKNLLCILKYDIKHPWKWNLLNRNIVHAKAEVTTISVASSMHHLSCFTDLYSFVTLFCYSSHNFKKFPCKIFKKFSHLPMHWLNTYLHIFRKILFVVTKMRNFKWSSTFPMHQGTLGIILPGLKSVKISHSKS
jgi:hypothetical protein